MANPANPEDETEAIRTAGSTPEDGNQSTHPRNWPGIPSPDEEDRMQRSAESGEGDVPDDAPEQEQPEQDLPSNRAQERGGP